MAALNSFQAKGAQAHLSQAIRWTKTVNEYFWDHDGAGYFNSPSDAIGLIARTKTVFDNATPSGNGIMATNLARLYYLTGSPNYKDRADILITSATQKTPNQGANMPSMMAGFEILQNALHVIVISDSKNNVLTKAVFSLGNPNLILLTLPPDTKVYESHPAFKKSQIGDQATAYVCRGKTCSLPYTETVKLLADLAN